MKSRTKIEKNLIIPKKTKKDETQEIKQIKLSEFFIKADKELAVSEIQKKATEQAIQESFMFEWESGFELVSTWTPTYKENKYFYYIKVYGNYISED